MRGVPAYRALANWVNLSTPAGLLLARRFCRGSARRTRNGLWLVQGYRAPVPAARAFTLGSVILLRAPSAGPGVDPVGSVDRGLLAHEERHATQYACCGGVLMPLIYATAAAWSWIATGDVASANPFERHAGLASGGYRQRGMRPVWARLRPGMRSVRLPSA